jgi:hypothetical protein
MRRNLPRCLSKSLDPGDRSPHLAIFWMREDGGLVIDDSLLIDSEAYGDCQTHPRSHIDQWEDFRRQAVVPTEIEYEEWPRGRVSLDMRRGVFLVLADRCILKRKSAVKQLISTLNLLPGKIEITTDAHYRCQWCLWLTNPSRITRQ